MPQAGVQTGGGIETEITETETPETIDGVEVAAAAEEAALEIETVETSGTGTGVAAAVAATVREEEIASLFVC